MTALGCRLERATHHRDAGTPSFTETFNNKSEGRRVAPGNRSDPFHYQFVTVPVFA